MWLERCLGVVGEDRGERGGGQGHLMKASSLRVWILSLGSLGVEKKLQVLSKGVA